MEQILLGRKTFKSKIDYSIIKQVNLGYEIILKNSISNLRLTLKIFRT